VHLDTAGFFGSRRHVIARGDLGGARFHRDVSPGAVGGQPVPSVDAPWLAVRIQGWRLPVNFDGQGEVLHPPLMSARFSGRRATRAANDGVSRYPMTARRSSSENLLP
jgi:hypothetical protein